VINRLEEELARQLRPVAAPEDLWLRIEEPRRSHTGAVLRWPVWAFAAALAATVALFCFSLARGVEEVQFRPTDPAHIRPPSHASMAKSRSPETSPAENARAGCVLCHS
jgi:hypothetical protein